MCNKKKTGPNDSSAEEQHQQQEETIPQPPIQQQPQTRPQQPIQQQPHSGTSYPASNPTPGYAPPQVTVMAPYTPAYPQVMGGQVYGGMGGGYGYNPAPFGGHGAYGGGYYGGGYHDGYGYGYQRSGGAIAAIVICIIFVVVLIIIGSIFGVRRRTYSIGPARIRG